MDSTGKRSLIKAKWQLQQQEAALTACELRILEFQEKIEQEAINIEAHKKAVIEYESQYEELKNKYGE